MSAYIPRLFSPKTQVPIPLDSTPFSSHKSCHQEHRWSESTGSQPLPWLPSPNLRFPPTVSHLPGGQGVPLPLCSQRLLPISARCLGPMRYIGTGGGELKTERLGTGLCGISSCLLSPLELPKVRRLEGVGRAGPWPLVGVGRLGNIPFSTQWEAPLSLPRGWSRQPHRWLSASGTWQPSLWQHRAQQQGPL